jgi:hypothetical protein
MRMLDDGLHRTGSIVAKNALDLVKEPPLCGIFAEKPSRNGEDDEKGWNQRKSRVKTDTRAHHRASDENLLMAVRAVDTSDDLRGKWRPFT